jgi:2-polyprenyl-3-methyl-5-hydroxy-6-metoxy-1,4-benzoquinol methylase
MHESQHAAADHTMDPDQYERVFGEQAWDERYRAKPQTWSGDPNPVLVTEVTDMPPGTALDAGAGEGGDACWLASRGWRVTGAELSTVALQRAADRANQFGLDIEWLHIDFAREPAPGRYDLVTAQFLHLPAAPRRVLFSHLAEAVVPGGTLLVVGHDPSDLNTTMPRPNLAEMFWRADEAAAGLGDNWAIEIAEARPRLATDPDGNQVTIHDAVLRARRSRH